MGRRERRREKRGEEENLLRKCPKEWAGAGGKLLFDSSESFPKDR